MYVKKAGLGKILRRFFKKSYGFIISLLRFKIC